MARQPAPVRVHLLLRRDWAALIAVPRALAKAHCHGDSGVRTPTCIGDFLRLLHAEHCAIVSDKSSRHGGSSTGRRNPTGADEEAEAFASAPGKPKLAQHCCAKFGFQVARAVTESERVNRDDPPFISSPVAGNCSALSSDALSCKWEAEGPLLALQHLVQGRG